MYSLGMVFEVQDDTTPTHFETDGLGGDYEIRVYDDAGCFAISAADTLLPFVEISDATVSTTQEAACSPLNNAAIEVGVTVSPSATTPDLQYVVTGINVTYSQTITSTNNPQAFTGLEFGELSRIDKRMWTRAVLSRPYTTSTILIPSR